MKYPEAVGLITKAKNIAVFVHVNPDGDCVGSALALYGFLKKLDKNVYCYTEGFDSNYKLSEKLQFLPNIDCFNKTRTVPLDLCIAVDTADDTRLDMAQFRLFNKGKKTLTIDHHEGKDFADVTVRESNAASNTQIVYKILCEIDKSKIDKDVATALFAGLVTDSGGFSFQSVSVETFQIASELLSYGIDNAEIYRRLIKDIPLNVFKLKNRVLSNVKFYRDGKIAIGTFRSEDFLATDTTDSSTEGIINDILNISNVELAITIAEISDKKFKASLRSKSKVNVNALAKCFGGGGHFHASGCKLFGYFEDVYDKLLTAAEEMYDYA